MFYPTCQTNNLLRKKIVLISAFHLYTILVLKKTIKGIVDFIVIFACKNISLGPVNAILSV